MANRTFPLTRTSLRAAVLCGAASFAIFAAPVAADVKAGVDAWSSGDYATAVAEWEGPAQAGDADALFNLAQAYRLGRGVAPDMQRASELYARAADNGHVKAADNYGLLLFQQGQQAQAMPLIKSAAERGDPRAQYVLGLAHFNADYAPKDWVRAYALLTLANGAGLPQAGTALQQMDNFVPMTQRQQAQSVARQIEAQAAQRRQAELAAIDLGTAQAGFETGPVQSAPPQPVRNAAITSLPAQPVPVQSAPAQSAPAPVRVAQLANPAPANAPAPAPVQRASGKWRVQLGAFGVAGNANRLWSSLQSNPALAGMQKDLVSGGNVTRLQAVGFASRADAQRACDTLKRQGQGCIVKQP